MSIIVNDVPFRHLGVVLVHQGVEVLLAQLVGSLQGPLTKLAATLQAVVDKENGAA